jgi:diphthine synthase
MTLLLDCKNENVKTKIVYSASIFDAISETGLQLYKFGKISSMPRWQKNFEPDSFLEFAEQNNSIKAHSLILVDIGLNFDNALNELELASNRRKFKLDKLIVCSNLGTSKSEIVYGKIENLKKKKIISPYCFIIPGEMHFMEKESVERFEI